MSRSAASSRPVVRRKPGSGPVPHPSFEPCDLYRPGHLVHPIQARRAGTSEEPVRWGRFAGIEDGLVVVRFLDGVERYRNHRPQEIAAVAEVGDKARVSVRYGVLSLHRRFEQLITVCVAPADAPWTPCSVADPALPSSPDDLAVRLEERGGFLVPGRCALRASDGETELDGA